MNELAEKNPFRPSHDNDEIKRKNRIKTKDEILTIIQNYKTVGKSKLAETLGLTEQQIYNTIKNTKDKVLTKIDDETDPDKKEKLQNFLETYLIVPRQAINGRTKGKTSLDAILDDIL